MNYQALIYAEGSATLNLVRNFAWHTMTPNMPSTAAVNWVMVWKCWLSIAEHITDDGNACHDWIFWTMQYFESHETMRESLPSNLRTQIYRKVHEVASKIPYNDRVPGIIERLANTAGLELKKLNLYGFKFDENGMLIVNTV